MSESPPAAILSQARPVRCFMFVILTVSAIRVWAQLGEQVSAYSRCLNVGFVTKRHRDSPIGRRKRFQDNYRRFTTRPRNTMTSLKVVPSTWWA